jgi:hypothetical protein
MPFFSCSLLKRLPISLPKFLSKGVSSGLTMVTSIFLSIRLDAVSIPIKLEPITTAFLEFLAALIISSESLKLLK